MPFLLCPFHIRITPARSVALTLRKCDERALAGETLPGRSPRRNCELSTEAQREMERKRRSGTRTTGQRELSAEEPASSSGQSPAKRERTDASPAVIQYHDVTAASFRIRKGVKETPLKVGRQCPHHTFIRAFVPFRNQSLCLRCWE